MSVSGYIISRRDWSDDLALRINCSTFGKSPTEAWLRHTQWYTRHSGRGLGELSKVIQQWSDKGYGPRPVEMRVLEKEDQR